MLGGIWRGTGPWHQCRRRPGRGRQFLAAGERQGLAKDDHGSGKPAATPAARRRPLPEYLTTGDYPAPALLAGQQGRVAIRMTVSAHGIPAECVVTETSGAAILDSTTCSIFLRRLRFTPALDAEGQSTSGSFTTAMRWALPADEPPPALPIPIRKQ